MIRTLKPNSFWRNFSTLPGFSPLSSLAKMKGWICTAKSGGKKSRNGCKLLYNDTKFLFSKKYAYIFYGEEYSISATKSIQRTSADLLKMIPFSFFIVVPFAELLLPACLYLFPNIVPSTFLNQSKQEAVWNTLISARKGYADKLHSFMLEKGKEMNSPELMPFLHEIRFRTNRIDRKQLIQNKEMLSKYLKFGNMDSDELINTCRFLGLEPWTGFQTFNKVVMTLLSKILSFFHISFPREYNPKRFPFSQIKRNIVMIQLRKRLKQIRSEDFELLGENIETLDLSVLRTLCRERAIDTDLNTEQQMRQQLKSWVRDSTYPSPKGLIPSEFLVFPQIFAYLDNSLHSTANTEHLPMAIFTVNDILGHNLERLLQFDKKEIMNLLETIEESELHSMKELQRFKIVNRLEEVLDDSLFFDQHFRIEVNIRRLEESLIKIHQLEGPRCI